MSDAEHAPHRANPYELLLVRRAEAEKAGADPDAAREDAVTEAIETMRRVTASRANHRCHHSTDYADDVASIAERKNADFCRQVYWGAKPAPAVWQAWVATIVHNTATDYERGHPTTGVTSIDRRLPGTGQTLGEVLAEDGTRFVAPEDAVEQQADADDRFARMQKLRADIYEGEVVCAFHPGPARRCAHVSSGDTPDPCLYLPVVLDAVQAYLVDFELQPVREHLRALTGLDGRRDGKPLRRSVYRCADWFCWLYLAADPHPSDAMKMLKERHEEALDAALSKKGTDAPSQATICILLNDYPDLPIPEVLETMYSPIHGGSRGASR